MPKKISLQKATRGWSIVLACVGALVSFAWVIGCGSFFGGAAIAYAQSAPPLAATPAVIDGHGLPHDILDYTLTVTNTGDQSVNVFASVYELTPDGEQAFIDPSISNRPATLADWIGISRGAMLFAPHETKSIPVTVTVNPYATAGDYHAVIAFVAGNTRPEAEAHLDVARRVLVNMSVASNKKEQLDLTSFGPARRFATGFPATVGYTIQNIGDVPSTPRGEVIFYDQIGHELGSVSANPDQATIAPGESKTFTATWGGDGGMGQYRVSIAMQYGATQSQLADSASFWVMPWGKLAIAFGLLLSFVLMLTVWWHRGYERRHHERRALFARLIAPPRPPAPHEHQRGTVDLRHPHHPSP